MNEIIWKEIHTIRKIFIGICKRKRLAGQEALQKRRPLAEMAFELKLQWQEDGHANIRENSTPDSRGNDQCKGLGWGRVSHVWGIERRPAWLELSHKGRGKWARKRGRDQIKHSEDGAGRWFDDLIGFWRTIMTAVWQTDGKRSQGGIGKPGRRRWQSTSREMTGTKMVPRSRESQDTLGRWNWQDSKEKGNYNEWWGMASHPHFSGKETEVQVTQLEAIRTGIWNQVCVAPEPPRSFQSSFFIWSFCSCGHCQRTGVWGLCIPCTPTAPHLGRKNKPRTS